MILDSSAILALLNGEEGAQRAMDALPGGRICAVNLAEVYGKLFEIGLSDSEARTAVEALGLDVIDFGADLALRTGWLYRECKKHGLSLADRACLAAGLHHKLAVVTADRKWKDVKGGPKVIIIR